MLRKTLLLVVLGLLFCSGCSTSLYISKSPQLGWRSYWGVSFLDVKSIGDLEADANPDGSGRLRLKAYQNDSSKGIDAVNKLVDLIPKP